MRFLALLFAVLALVALFAAPAANADASDALHAAKVKAGVEDPTIAERVQGAAATASKQAQDAGTSKIKLNHV